MDTNPKTRFGAMKPDLSLVPPSSLIYQALAMQEGRDKYGPYNWREKEVSARTYLSAAYRHLCQYQDREDVDPKSKYPHLGHALACIGILIDAIETGNLVDDRPLPGAAAKLIDQWTKKEDFVTGVTNDEPDEYQFTEDADWDAPVGTDPLTLTYVITPEQQTHLRAELDRATLIKTRVEENKAAQLELDLQPFRHIPRT